MLNVILGFCEILKCISYYSFVVSYEIGKFIVNGLFASTALLTKFFQTLLTVLTVIFEDLTYFLTDFTNRIELVLRTISLILESLVGLLINITNYIHFIASSILTGIITTFGTIYKAFLALIVNIKLLIATIKHVFVLLGSGVWFVITLVPFSLVYTCTLCTYYIGRLFEEAKLIINTACDNVINFCVQTYYFVTDVPLEACIGLFICVCFGYLLVKFHLAVLRSVIEIIKKVVRSVQEYLVYLKSNLTKRKRSVADCPAENSKNVQNDLDEHLCTICIQRKKCVLIMPCRHLCMCSECCELLSSYQRSCPICRHTVQYTIKVY